MIIRYSQWDDSSLSRDERLEQLLRLFSYLLTKTSGDVDEALDWLSRIDEQYGVARKILEDNRDKVEAMTAALLEWETIDADQIDDIVNNRPPRPPKAPQGPADSSDTSASSGLATGGTTAVA